MYNNIVKKYKVVDEKDTTFSSLSPSKTMRNKKNSVTIMYSNAPAINDLYKYKKFLYQKPNTDKQSYSSSLPRIPDGNVGYDSGIINIPSSNPSYKMLIAPYKNNGFE